MGHGSNKEDNGLVLGQRWEVLGQFNSRSIPRECDFSGIWREMVCNGVLDDFNKFVWAVDGSNGEFMEELDWSDKIR